MTQALKDHKVFFSLFSFAVAGKDRGKNPKAGTSVRCVFTLQQGVIKLSSLLSASHTFSPLLVGEKKKVF